MAWACETTWACETAWACGTTRVCETTRKIRRLELDDGTVDPTAEGLRSRAKLGQNDGMRL